MRSNFHFIALRIGFCVFWRYFSWNLGIFIWNIKKSRRRKIFCNTVLGTSSPTHCAKFQVRRLIFKNLLVTLAVLVIIELVQKWKIMLSESGAFAQPSHSWIYFGGFGGSQKVFFIKLRIEHFLKLDFESRKLKPL